MHSDHEARETLRSISALFYRSYLSVYHDILYVAQHLSQTGDHCSSLNNSQYVATTSVRSPVLHSMAKS